tara:strand:+ start:60 stop:605 length:546 start_codon:yes stop_codon:yes gene_type:complete
MKNLFTKGLNIPKDWVDTFYGNDAMASYEVGDLRIWIDHPIATESELYDESYGDYKRFAIVCSDKYKDENPNDHYIDDVLFTTNDFTEVLAWVKKNPYGANTGRDVNGNPLNSSAKAVHKRVEAARLEREVEIQQGKEFINGIKLIESLEDIVGQLQMGKISNTDAIETLDNIVKYVKENK